MTLRNGTRCRYQSKHDGLCGIHAKSDTKEWTLLDRAKKIAQIIGASAAIAKAVETIYHVWCNKAFSATKADVYILQDGARAFHKKFSEVNLESPDVDIEEIVVLHHDFQHWWKSVPKSVKDVFADHRVDDFEAKARLTSN
jgi:hypothetical protein